MNITGIWTYKEDFEYGKSDGVVEIKQSGNKIVARFPFPEEVKSNYKIEVVEKTKGTISDDKILLESVQVKAIQGNKEIDYLPNNFEVHLVSENRLVGSTYDSEGICGVFVMERKKKL